MHNEKTVLQRLSEASHSSDLKHYPRRCDVDLLHAAGMAGQRSDLGHALLTLDRTLDRRDVPAALRETIALVQEVGGVRGWSLHPLKCRRIAAEVLKLYVEPACPACKGRGAVGLERDQAGQRAERVRPCHVCAGSGQRPVPQKWGREIRAVLYVLQNRRHEIGQRVRRAMGVRADVD